MIEKISEVERATLKKYSVEEGGRESTKLAILIHMLDKINETIDYLKEETK